MKNLLVILFVAALLSCKNDLTVNEPDNKFIGAKESVRKYAKEHFDSNYVLVEGSVGLLKEFSDEQGNKFYEQAHLGVPVHKDSISLGFPWVYYQLDSNLNVISYSRKSKITD